MSAKPATPERKTAVLRRLMKEERLIVAPGVYDAYSARMTQAMGFKMAVTSGAGIANSHFGHPDLGIMTRTDNLEACRMLVRSLDIPLTADADTGYGNAVSAYHTVQMFEDIGVCGVNIEDQVFPKRCGHLKGKEIIPAEDMARKIEAASAARKDPDFMIIARTDALAIEGIEGAVRRGKMYADAGADMLFADAVRTEEDIKRLVKDVPLPLTVNIGFGIRSRPTTPLVPVKRLAEWGVKRVSVPRMLPAAALMGMRQAFQVFKDALESDVPVDRPDLTFTIDEITELMDYEKAFGLERRFLSEDELDSKYRVRNVDEQVSHVLPLYFQTFVILQQQIKEGLWPATAPIPSENELAERFGVSRVTIRKAMALLEKQNYVLRQRGRGTYVNEAVVERDRRSNFSGLLENILDFQQNTTVKILSFGKVAAPETVAQQLNLTAGEDVMRVIRIRSDGRTPISHVSGYVPYPEARLLKREDLGNNTLISCLEAAGLRASSAEQGLSATLADAEIARLLKIEVGAPLISMWRTVKDLGGRPIEFMRTLYRPDRYEYRVVLSRDSVSHSPRWSEVG